MLEQAQDGIRNAGGHLPGVSWVRPGTIHLTLKFLGEVDEGRANDIAAAVEKAAAEVSPFTLTAGGVGGFPSLKNPRVLWVGIEDGPGGELAGLQKNLDLALSEVGFDKDDRPFRPHLTLGRVRTPADGRAAGRAASALAPGTSVRFWVESFYLYKSELKPTGAVHTKLKKFILRTREG